MKNELKEYTDKLERHYSLMTVDDRKQLRVNIARVISLGFTLLLLTFVYPVVPIIVRIFSVPMLVVGVWYLSGKIDTVLELLQVLKRAPALSAIGVFLMVAFLIVGIIFGARQ